MSFESWAAVLAHVDAGNKRLLYKPPMDLHASVVWVGKRYKNGKLRLTRADVAFTADAGHLGRISVAPK